MWTSAPPACSCSPPLGMGSLTQRPCRVFSHGSIQLQAQVEHVLESSTGGRKVKGRRWGLQQQQGEVAGTSFSLFPPYGKQLSACAQAEVHRLKEVCYVKLNVSLMSTSCISFANRVSVILRYFIDYTCLHLESISFCT